MAKRKNLGISEPAPPKAAWHRRWGVWLIAAVMLGILAVGIASRLSATAYATQTQRLVGRWLRPDGGYVLDIRAARADGQLEAAYFNPRSIHVAQAIHERKGGNMTVFVELRDINYPGSTYALRYLPGEDRLVGEYFQALQQQTFDVEFVRSN